MQGNIIRLYPQFEQNTDRRRQNQPISEERRSGFDRRAIPRALDSKTQADFYQVRETFKDFIGSIDAFGANVDKFDESLKHQREVRQEVFSALSPIAPLRRVSSIPDNIEEGNYEKAAGLAALAVVNLPEDTRDLKSAFRRIFKGELPKYDYKNCQAPFSFFRGTVLEPVVNKMGKVGVWLYSKDKSLYYTKFGKCLRKIFKTKVDELESEATGRIVPQVILDEKGKPIITEVKVFAQRLEGNSISKLVGRAILRIPVMSLAILGLLELPSIAKKVKNAEGADNKLKEGTTQVLKSSLNIISVTAGISLVGALFSRKGPAFSLLGMGIGSVAGSLFSKTVQEKIENLSTKR